MFMAWSGKKRAQVTIKKHLRNIEARGGDFTQGQTHELSFSEEDLNRVQFP